MKTPCTARLMRSCFFAIYKYCCSPVDGTEMKQCSFATLWLNRFYINIFSVPKILRKEAMISSLLIKLIRLDKEPEFFPSK